MIVVYPFFQGDQDLALKNAQWITELGGCRGHEAYMIYDQRCGPQAEYVEQELKKSFDNVYTLCAKAEINGWPQGANYFFRLATANLQSKPDTPYFFWMEPDAIPLREGWMDTIVAEHLSRGLPFTGDRVEVENIPLHMSGVGIYPNPLHQFAGEAYRAADIAWDMAGKDQIVPQANFTKLIEHAWRHPAFPDMASLESQIRPEAVLFHSSKDGSLIDLLRSKRSGKHASIRPKAQPKKEPEEPGSPAPPSAAPKTESTATTVPRTGSPSLEEIGDRAEQRPFIILGHNGNTVYDSRFPVCDIFIRTYPGDYDWLYYCLESIHKFCTGFRKIWIVSPAEPPVWFRPDNHTEWKVMNEESEDHYLSQQIHKLYADVITDYQADYIMHVDSDVIFHTRCTPDNFLLNDKVIWFYTPYTEIQAPWQPITEKFIGEPVEFEFMRRFPLVMPRWLYPKLREYCHRRHGMIVSDYIRLQPNRAFSEFNALGAYAWKAHRDKFEWFNTLEVLPPPLAKQYHSWSGLTDDKKAEITAYLYGGNVPVEVPGSGLPAGIRSLHNDKIWVLERDVEISGWIEQAGRLDHDQNLLPLILEQIKPGDTVVDAGAFVGDHTEAYLKKVGAKGVVHAIEPNPLAMKCLKHNLPHNHNLHTYEIALGNEAALEPMSSNNGNMGGAYLGTHMAFANVRVLPLDELDLKPDFIKFDVEGSEVEALRGAEKTIAAHHPTMVVEVNYEALKRQGHTVGELFAILEGHGYNWMILQENCGPDAPMYDILCKAAKTSPENKGEFLVVSPSPVNPPSIQQQIKEHIDFIKEVCNASPQNRAMVMQRLVYAGLKEPKKKKKKKNEIPVPDLQKKKPQKSKKRAASFNT